MILFLTSSPCDDNVPEGVDLPCILNENNWFVENMREYWIPDTKCLIIAADPENYELNDEMAETFFNAFNYHDLTISEMMLCDMRNAEDIEDMVSESDMIILGGGHVPTANIFYWEMGLPYLLEDYDGIIMGISAGTMNCAEIVYAQPEMPGESIDPDYERYIPGLGLTDINVLPHYQEVKDNILDGRRLYEDITYEDSMDNAFIVLVDGSYVLQKDDEQWVFGESYLLWNGEMEQLCEDGENLELNTEI